MTATPPPAARLTAPEARYVDATLAQLLSELFRLARENDALRARIKELEAAASVAEAKAPAG